MNTCLLEDAVRVVTFSKSSGWNVSRNPSSSWDRLRSMSARDERVKAILSRSKAVLAEQRMWRERRLRTGS